MKFFQFNNVIVSWGFKVKPQEYQAFQEYTEEMFRRDRVIVLFYGKEIQGVLFYYLTKDYKKLYKKSLWQIPPEDPEGHQIYFDKLICRRWTKEFRTAVKLAVEHKFPHIKEAYYHRAPFDRCVKILTETGVLCSKT